MKLTSPNEIKEIAQKFGFVFKKGLGQNFLTSEAVLADIVSAAEIDGGVLEIGPGFGVLTSELAKKAEKVVSIELDQRLLPVLRYTLSDYDNIKIINADVLKADLKKIINEEFPNEKISIAANLPYYITTPVITRLLEDKLPVKTIVVMVQKEVAQRLTAKSSSKDYGAITLLCRYYARAEIVETVSAGLFVPAPKVDSAVLKLTLLERPAVSVRDENMFFRTVRAAFSQRRKTLLNCLASGFSLPKQRLTGIIESVGIEPARRGETLEIEEFAALADVLYEATE